MGTIIILLLSCCAAGLLEQTKWGKEFTKDC